MYAADGLDAQPHYATLSKRGKVTTAYPSVGRFPVTVPCHTSVDSTAESWDSVWEVICEELSN